MNRSEELKKISEKPSHEVLVKRYFLDCCEKLTRFRSSDCLHKNLFVARKFLKGIATQKQMHQAEWEIEAEAFGAEHYSDKSSRHYFRVDKHIKADLIQVRISKGLSNVDSRKYLIDLAYFINYVFCHVEYSSNWLFTDECEKFMCPILLKKHFGNLV